jgi:hypothetical protein
VAGLNQTRRWLESWRDSQKNKIEWKRVRSQILGTFSEKLNEKEILSEIRVMLLSHSTIIGHSKALKKLSGALAHDLRRHTLK